jgi:hypothetical protein
MLRADFADRASRIGDRLRLNGQRAHKAHLRLEHILLVVRRFATGMVPGGAGDADQRQRGDCGQPPPAPAAGYLRHGYFSRMAARDRRSALWASMKTIRRTAVVSEKIYRSFGEANPDRFLKIFRCSDDLAKIPVRILGCISMRPALARLPTQAAFGRPPSTEIADNSVQYDDTGKGTVTLDGATGTTITNLKAGQVNATSTDAINGGQLYNVSNSIAANLGGDATVNLDGTINGPTYTMQGANYTNVYDTFAAVDNSLTNINNAINDINNGDGVKYFHTNSIAADSQAIGQESVAIGPLATTNADNSVAIGPTEDSVAYWS